MFRVVARRLWHGRVLQTAYRASSGVARPSTASTPTPVEAVAAEVAQRTDLKAPSKIESPADKIDAMRRQGQVLEAVQLFFDTVRGRQVLECSDPFCSMERRPKFPASWCVA